METKTFKLRKPLTDFWIAVKADKEALILSKPNGSTLVIKRNGRLIKLNVRLLAGLKIISVSVERNLDSYIEDILIDVEFDRIEKIINKL